MAGTLYVVGTPIGNLGDFSPRAVQTLREVDFIAAEDTRVTLKLLNRFDIKKPMVSYFEHNKRERGEIICARLEEGESCALVTDAGMPAISDPGEELVRQCAQRGIQTAAVPGPSAVITALALSGLPTGRFTFEGFLSMNKKSRARICWKSKTKNAPWYFTRRRTSLQTPCAIYTKRSATGTCQSCASLRRYMKKPFAPRFPRRRGAMRKIPSRASWCSWSKAPRRSRKRPLHWRMPAGLRFPI